MEKVMHSSGGELEVPIFDIDALNGTVNWIMRRYEAKLNSVTV